MERRGIVEIWVYVAVKSRCLFIYFLSKIIFLFLLLLLLLEPVLSFLVQGNLKTLRFHLWFWEKKENKNRSGGNKSDVYKDSNFNENK